MDKKYICKYCNKECKNLNSLKQHEIRCKLNPNRINMDYIKPGHLKSHKGTNQFIKAKELGLPKPIVSDETKKKLSKVWKNKKHTNKSKELIKNTINYKILNNEWHNENNIKILYKNIYFDSSWEVNFVKYLENKNIIQERPKKYFKYYFNNGIHNYYPDLYLPEYDLYIEIKGQPNERDYEKWNQFTEKLDIYDSKDLYELGILNKYDLRNLIKEEFRNKHIKF